MKDSELKRQYFRKGATALKRITSIDQECYCCPLCGRLFVSKAIDAGILTIEHAAPKKVGGHPLALTCKECNSVSGYTIDAAVVGRKKLLDAEYVILAALANGLACNETKVIGIYKLICPDGLVFNC